MRDGIIHTMSLVFNFFLIFWGFADTKVGIGMRMELIQRWNKIVFVDSQAVVEHIEDVLL